MHEVRAHLRWVANLQGVFNNGVRSPCYCGELFIQGEIVMIWNNVYTVLPFAGVKMTPSHRWIDPMLLYQSTPIWVPHEHPRFGAGRGTSYTGKKLSRPVAWSAQSWRRVERSRSQYQNRPNSARITQTTNIFFNLSVSQWPAFSFHVTNDSDS